MDYERQEEKKSEKAHKKMQENTEKRKSLRK